MTFFKRASGILLHPTSLPSLHGIGDLGREAHAFLNFLKSAGQTWWQMLPLTPPGFGDSPYNTVSAFAGNPLLISLESLVRENLLSHTDLKVFENFPSDRVCFNLVRKSKDKLLRKAFATFLRSQASSSEFRSFVAKNQFWLEDFSLYQTLKQLHRGKGWYSWKKDYRERRLEALREVQTRHRHTVLFHQFLQFEFDRQWRVLKAHAQKKGIKLLGDIPIFMAHDSVEVWAHPHLFKLKKNGRPQRVAGVPPDYFSKNGQLWGNPVYNWPHHAQQKFTWWMNRFERSFEMFDGLRLDHFIGYYRTWEVKASAKTARKGRWTEGPRDAFFRTFVRTVGRVPVIAENLGMVIPPIEALREKYNLPGMFILQFAFGGSPDETRERLAQIPKHSVVYTGTHDNNTTVGWFRERESHASTRSREQIALEKANILAVLNSRPETVHWDLIEMALSLKSDLAIVPLQDVLGLGSNARMNLPGSKLGNWNWRFSKRALTPALQKRLKILTKTYERLL